MNSQIRPLAGTLLALVLGAIGAGQPSLAAAEPCPNEALRIEQGDADLPDCRAYELVSPADKRGHDIVVDTGRFQIAQRETPASPAAATFTSLGGFAEPTGSGVGFEYLAQRTLEPGTQGWGTNPINPLQSPQPFVGVLNTQAPLYLGEADADLSRRIFRADLPIGSAPNVERVDNLYLRSDLRDAGPGSYQLLSDASTPLTPLPLNRTAINALPNLAAVSADLSRVLFESVFPLTPDAPKSTASAKLYKSVDGQVELVGILPNGSAAPRSIAGQGAGSSTGSFFWTPHVLSGDGSRAFFTVPADDLVTGSDDVAGALYMRDDHGTLSAADDTTTWLDQPEGPSELTAPSTYWDAAADGSRVFFTSEAALTADSPAGAIQKLYVYDATRPAGDPDNLTYISADHEPADPPSGVAGTLGLSDDGHSVYFAQQGQIVAGQPSLNGLYGIYLWRQGVGVSYVGALPSERDVRDDLGGFAHQPVTFPTQLGARVSPDGRFLLFSTTLAPWPGGADQGSCPNYPNGCPNLYLYDAQSAAHPACISCPPDGPPHTPAFFSTRVAAGGSSISATDLNSPLIASGEELYFTTAEQLLPEDLNGADDVYQYRRVDQSLRLISAGNGPADSYFMDATPDGHDVYIATRDRLSPWDTDESRDLYDVRVDGGISGPPPAPAPCQGEGCKGAASAPPPLPPSPSAGLVGPADRKPTRPRCPAHRRAITRKGKTICAKPKHRRAKGGGHRRAPATDRGARR